MSAEPAPTLWSCAYIFGHAVMHRSAGRRLKMRGDSNLQRPVRATFILMLEGDLKLAQHGKCVAMVDARVPSGSGDASLGVQRFTASVFGGGNVGRGPRRTTHCRTLDVSCAFASHVRRSLA